MYDDVGRTIKVRVSFTDDASHEETLTSAPTEAVTLLVWSATLTAGTRETHSGYNLLHSTGALSQTEFTLGGDDYTVKMVVEGDDGLLSFGLDRRLRTDFTLNVGGVPFSSEDASTTKTGFVHTYQWDKGTVDWSVGDEVELSLTVMGTPATGQPTINGTVQVGETLTADTSGIADADGLDDAVFSYQWIAGGTDIQDATSSTYTLDADDVGKTIKVRMSFTDNADNEETLTSAATATVAAKPNTAPTGLPIISGRVQVGETLTASTSGIADEDGLDNASFSYQWLADDSAITDATGSTYTLVPADRGKTIKVKVSFADDANNLETLTSAAMAAVAARPNSPPTGLPTISGTVQVGETLTADTSGIADEDGLDNVSYSYQWIAGAADIDGATGSTYALVPVDVGKAIKVKVSFTDDAKNQEALTSAATAAVAAADNRAPTGLPTIRGTVQLDETLTADTSVIADEDGLDDVTYSYQWIAGGSDIDGATGSSHTLTTSQQGQTIQVRVSFTDDRNNAEALTSGATGAVAAAVNRPATGLPTIGGTAQVGETLTASTSDIADQDGLDNATFSYQWLADDSAITDATGSTYTLVPADQGKTIKVRVSFTDDADNEETLTSAATAAVAAKPNSPATGAPTISGTAQVGKTLTADTSGIADEDGLDNVSYSYQWIRSDGSNDTDIEGEKSSTYTLVPADQGKTIKVKVSFTDDANNVETLTSAATAAVAAADNHPATGLPTISGTVQVDQTLTADTSGIADEDGLTNVPYSYQWIAGGSDIDGATGSNHTLTTSQQGQTVQVRVSFTDDRNNAETLTSGATATVAAKPNSPATGLPTISGTVQVGETLTASTSDIADQDGLDNATFSYQWLADDSAITDATGSTYTLVPADRGKTIKVKVSFADDANNLETLTSAAMAAVAARPNSPPTGLAHHQRDGAGGGDADCGYERHSRRGRAGQRVVQLSVDRRGGGHRRGHRLHLRPCACRRGQGHQGEGFLHRRRE